MSKIKISKIAIHLQPGFDDLIVFQKKIKLSIP